uniref:Uncharacterized protein n=1 Tax=Meloidogyne enterolobii TaxID=390850 RepID=A0A6V7U0U1_MELEN|nr:unnamed protein product [Meloidogyne enterolobii]
MHTISSSGKFRSVYSLSGKYVYSFSGRYVYSLSGRHLWSLKSTNLNLFSNNVSIVFACSFTPIFYFAILSFIFILCSLPFRFF